VGSDEVGEFLVPDVEDDSVGDPAGGGVVEPELQPIKQESPTRLSPSVRRTGLIMGANGSGRGLRGVEQNAVAGE